MDWRSTILTTHLTIELPPEIQARLKAEAERPGVSIADVIVALAEGIPEPTEDKPERRLSFIGIGASGRTEPFDTNVLLSAADRSMAEYGRGAALLDERTDIAITGSVAVECS